MRIYCLNKPIIFTVATVNKLTDTKLLNYLNFNTILKHTIHGLSFSFNSITISIDTFDRN